MTNSNLLAQFDRSKPFYPLVMQYVTQIVGFRELTAHGILGAPDAEFGILDVESRAENKKISVAELKGLMDGLRPPYLLRSSVRAEPIEISTEEVAAEVTYGFNYKMHCDHFPFFLTSILVLAHELCKDNPSNDDGPLWEFLRQGRNGAAHGGTFNLLNGEPRHPAMWRSLEISPALHRTPVLKGVDRIGLLSAADPILLLSDIEKAYPTLR